MRLNEINSIINQTFNFLIDFGFEMVKNETSFNENREELSVSYTSENREFNIHYFSYLNSLSNPKGTYLENTSINILSVDKEGLKKQFNLNGYLYFKEPNKPDFIIANKDNKDGQNLDQYKANLQNIKTYLVDKLTPVITGKEWISAHWTRLDGFKIQNKTKTEYFE